jgi:hypothetical protein
MHLNSTLAVLVKTPKTTSSSNALPTADISDDLLHCMPHSTKIPLFLLFHESSKLVFLCIRWGKWNIWGSYLLPSFQQYKWCKNLVIVKNGIKCPNILMDFLWLNDRWELRLAFWNWRKQYMKKAMKLAVIRHRELY